MLQKEIENLARELAEHTQAHEDAGMSSALVRAAWAAEDGNLEGVIEVLTDIKSYLRWVSKLMLPWCGATEERVAAHLAKAYDLLARTTQHSA